MNPHYHPYSELNSPHPPSPDGGPYPLNGHPPSSYAHPHHAQHHAAHHLPHHNNNNSPALRQCAGCGGKIVERFLLFALDRYWHNGCLKCSCCGAMLAEIGASCYTKGGMILCKTDYTRMFGSSGACAACGQTIPASEFVMRTGGGLPGGGAPPSSAPQHHVFHLKCFACSKCGAHLVPGDRYYMLAGSLVCEQDWHKLLKGSGGATGAAGAPGAVRKGKVGRPRRSRD
ncbi:LIM domain transcription factor LMO4.2 [Arctopsyche grandis]|uniref:LIM domain transcription factor LMO4.2 n=1 Tax=Arctopsyche grandis TaxID=121162 RepID=UPI00406D7FB8